MGDKCVFCEIGQDPVSEPFAYADSKWVVLPSRHQRPQNLGHTLIVPRQHYQDLHELPAVLDAELLGLARRVARALEDTFGASGTSLRQNNGPPGQTVFHFHLHVMPRFEGDENAFGDWREVPEETRAEQAQLLRSHL